MVHFWGDPSLVLLALLKAELAGSGRKAHFDLTSTLSSLTHPKASEEVKACLPKGEGLPGGKTPELKTLSSS